MKINKILIPIFICLCLIAYTVGYSTVSKTTNLELSKPASEDLTVDWFDTMNDNMDLIDAIFDTVSLTEYGYLDGVTSAIQTQLNAKIEATLTEEEVEDYAGGMWTENTETFIELTYQDADGTVDAVVPVKDEDNMASNSATHLATQQSIKAYADTFQPLDTALTNISALAYVSPSFIKLTATDTYAVRTLAEVKTDLSYQLSDLSDVGVTTPTDKYVLVADGDSWESRAITSDALSDVASIGMLDENELITGQWGIDKYFYILYVSDTPESGGRLFLEKERDGDPTHLVQDGDELGRLVYTCYYTGDHAWIRVIADGTTGDHDAPGRLEFLTTPDGADVPDLRMAIDNAGNIRMGDGAWTNYVNVDNAGAMTFEGTATINEPLSIMASTTSAELAGVVSDETGTLKLVYSDSPVFTTQITTPKIVSASNADITIQPNGTGDTRIYAPADVVTTVTAAHTMTIAEAGTVLVSCAATPYTITLPTAVGHSGLRYHFIKTDANYFLITLDGNGAQTFNYENATSAPVQTYPRLNTLCAEVTVVSDNANWQVIDEAMGQVPMARVYLQGDYIAVKNATFTVVGINAETFDVGDNFDLSTWVSGDMTSYSASHLVDSGGAFDAEMAGHRVKNTTDSTYAYVTVVNSATDLTLSADIFDAVGAPWDAYEIKHCKYVIPIAGKYECSGFCNYDAVGMVANKRFFAALFYGVNTNIESATLHSGVATKELGMSLATTALILAVDDGIKLRAYHEAGVDTIRVDGDYENTWMYIRLISKE